MKKSFTLIELMIVIAIIAIIAAISLPNLLAARKHGNEVSAIASIRTLTAAEAIYLDQSTASVFGNLTNLNAASLINETLGAGAKQGYGFTATPSATSPQYIYTSSASPQIPGETGDRYFFANQDGVIRFNTLTTATSADPAVGSK